MAQGRSRDDRNGAEGASRGRPRDQLDGGLDPAIGAFAEIMRAGVFEPLKLRGYSLQALAGRLGAGYSTATLQRISAGSRVPPCDGISAILKLVEDVLERPMRAEVRQTLWASYYNALRIADPRLYEFYLLVQERDAWQEWFLETVEREGELRTQLLLVTRRAQRKDRELQRVRQHALEDVERLERRQLTAGHAVRSELEEAREEQRVLAERLEVEARERAALEEEVAELAQIVASALPSNGSQEPGGSDGKQHLVEELALVRASLVQAREDLARTQQDLDQATSEAVRREQSLRAKAADDLAAAQDRRRQAAEQVKQANRDNEQLRDRARQLVDELAAVRAEAAEVRAHLEEQERRLQERLDQDATLAEAEQAVTEALHEMSTPAQQPAPEPNRPAARNVSRGATNQRPREPGTDFSLAQSVDSAVHIVLGLHREGLLEEAAAEARRLGRERSFRDLASLVRVLSDSGADGYVANVLEAPAQRRVVEVVELARCLRGANAYRFVKVLTRQFAKTRSPAELAELAVLLRTPTRDGPVWQMWATAMERSVTDISAALGHLLAAEDPDFEAVYTLLRVSTDQMSDYKRSILVNSVQDPAMRQKVEELLATLTREALTTAGEE